MKTRLIFLTIIGLLAFSAAASAQDQEQKEESKVQYTSIIDMLRRQPGLQIGMADAGVMPRILIRGIGTNTDQTQPLFVVDGVITDNITYILPNDVYSIEVIKDGTASIYGMQGANGVIEITTKTAREAAEKAAKQAREAKSLARESKKLEREAAKAAKAAEKAAAKAAKEAEKAAKKAK